MTNTTYLESRLKEIGLEMEDCTFNVKDHNTGHNVERTLLSADEEGNIKIHYNLPEGSPITYHIPGRKGPLKYIRTRLKRPKGDAKYLSPKGSGQFPFLPPNIISKYQNSTPIETLVIVEGEFKALAGDKKGLDIIGIPSIHGFYGEERDEAPSQKSLASEIERIIKECRVKNIIYLTDADTLALNYKPEKELSQRPTSFYTAVRNFLRSAKKYVYDDSYQLKNLFFSHIKSEFNSYAKGLDDLFNKKPNETQEIVNDILKFDLSDQYFKTTKLNSMDEIKLKRYFGLVDATNFFHTYRESLKDCEFVFQKTKYYHNGERLITLKNYELDEYMRIGADYYRQIVKPRMVEGMIMRVSNLSPWKKSEITTDYGRDSISLLKKYNGFVNIPNWLNHEKVIDNCFNVCDPLPYTPIAGSIEHSIAFLKHISSEYNFIELTENGITENPELGNTGTMLLDYFSIMFQKPTNHLPIPCLLSKEQETGKTTFALWTAAMFEGNSIIIRTDEFSGDFNSHFAGKFFVAIDEGKIDNKRATKEKIKQMSTSPTVTLNRKGVAQVQVENHSKFCICSNDEDDFIQLERTDIRFLPIIIKTLELKDPEFKNKLFKEIPHFAHFVMNREIFHPKESRAWFDPKYVQNEHFQKIMNSSKPHWQQEIDDTVVHIFDNIEENTFYMDQKGLYKAVMVLNRKSRITSTSVGRYLKKELQMEVLDNQRRDTYLIQEDTYAVIKEYKKVGRHLRFEREKWL